MTTLTIDRQAAVIGALVEGCSIRSTERMTVVHRDSIMRLTRRVAKGAERLLDESIRKVRCERLELDEVWAFVGKKRNHVRRSDDPKRVGDFWTWVALDPDTKLVPAYTVGKRDWRTATEFAYELERRVDSGEAAAAFSLYPTRMEDLMAVADAGRVMPPKSTWFEPKLADGLVSHVLD